MVKSTKIRQKTFCINFFGVPPQIDSSNTHTLAFEADFVLLGRAESVGLIGRPGDRARHTGESDLTRLLLSRAIILMLTMGFRYLL